MKRENIEAVFRLSPLQEGLLFHSLYAPGAGTYVNQHLIEFEGELDFDAFQGGWRRLIERHQALRASFHWQESDRPLQVIARNATLSVERIDLRGLSSSARQRHIEEYLRTDRRRDFHLSEAPLMRLTLIRLAEDTYQLYWCNHHLILDGWSASILAQEFLAVYAALKLGLPPDLPPAPSFRDYIAWLQKQDLDCAEKFWRETLGDFAEPRPLSINPTALPRTADFPESERYAHLEHRLTDTATRSLGRFARQNGITLGTLVQGAWAVLLSRYLDRSDIVFGMTSSGRSTDIRRIDSMVGLLINTLPVRVAVEPQAQVIQLLRAVQDYNLRLREFEYSPLAQVQSWSAAPPGSPLFDTLLVFENYPVDETVTRGSGGLRIRQIQVMETTNYPLALMVGPGASMSIQAGYDRACFEAEAVTQVLGHFAQLLQEMAVQAERPVCALRMLTEDEKRRLIAAPPQPADALPRNPNGKIDRQALPEPDHVRPSLEETYAAPQTEIERQLAEIWSEALRIEQVGIHDNYFSLGGDSLLSMRLCAKAIKAGLRITVRMLYEHPTIAGLAAVCGASQVNDIEQDRMAGPVPLAPAQCFFFEFEHSNPHHYNLAGLLRVRARLTPQQWRRLARGLAERHGALRLRFIRLESGWTAMMAPLEPDSLFNYVDLSKVEPSRRRSLIEESAARLQGSLNITDGPLFKLIYFDTGDEYSSRLMFLIHHLAADGQSLWILLEDLEAGVTQLVKGEDLSFPVGSSSWRRWVEALNSLAHSGALQSDMDYWLRVCAEPPCPLPRDMAGGRNINATASELRLLLSREETVSLFARAQAGPQGELQTLLATALARALSLWTGADRVSFDWIGHGREPLVQSLDVSRTVGYFTDRAPITLRLSRGETIDQSLNSVRTQLQGLPHRGMTWGILRYLSPDLIVRRQLQKAPRPEVSLNYLGDVDRLQGRPGLIELVEEDCGPPRDPLHERACPIQLFAAVQDGQFEIACIYNETYYRRETAQRVAGDFLDALRDFGK